MVRQREISLFCALGLLGLVALLPLMSGCATTTQARSVEQAGFLGNYSMLREGEGDEALLIYLTEKADWTPYEKIQIDSVTVWTSDATKDIDQEDAQVLSDHFYKAIHDQLSKVIVVTDYPGPDTLVLRAAITGGEDAAVVGNVITTVVPQLRLLTTLGGVVTKTSVFVGEAAAEVEIRDSMTNRRLAAAVDRRLGTKTLRGMFSDWADVEKALDHWAERIARRLAEQKGIEFPED